MLIVQPPYGFARGLVAPGPATLKAVLTACGQDTRVIDLNGQFLGAEGEFDADVKAATLSLDYPEFLTRAPASFLAFLDAKAATVAAARPRVVALSVAFRPGWWPAVHLARRIKETTACLTIAGGAAFDGSVADFIGRSTPQETIDLYSIGEGERALVDLIELLPEPLVADDTWRSRMIAAVPGLGLPIPGVGMRMGQRYADVVADLDRLPVADFSDYNLTGVRTLPVTLARSCNARCAFCSSRKTHTSYRMLSGARAARELTVLAERHGITRFYFTAPLVNGNPDRLRDLCHELIRIGSPFQLAGLFRLTRRMDERDIALMCKAGFNWIKFGLESGSPAVRRSMGKLPDQDHCRRLMKAVAAHGARAATNIMHSFPTEDEPAFEDTLAFLDQFTPGELEWQGWPFNLGFTGNGALDQEFVTRFKIRVLENHGLSRTTLAFSLNLRWENDLITPSVIEDRERRLKAFRIGWLAKHATVGPGASDPESVGVVEIAPG